MEGIGFAGNLAGHHLKYPAISGTWRGALATSFAIDNKQSCALAAAAPDETEALRRSAG